MCVGILQLMFSFSNKKMENSNMHIYFTYRVVHIMLTIFTIMLILYAQKLLLLCSKSPTIILKIFPPDHPFFTAILEIGI